MSKVYVFESRGGTYIGAKVPSLIGPAICRSWPCCRKADIKRFLIAATKWQLDTGVNVWGETRFLKYLAGEVTSQNLRGELHSVSVYEAYTSSKDKMTKYKYIRVEWRDRNKRGQCRSFSKRKFGCLLVAEHNATIFAAYKRAELTGGELNLPDFKFDLSVFSHEPLTDV